MGRNLQGRVTRGSVLRSFQLCCDDKLYLTYQGPVKYLTMTYQRVCLLVGVAFSTFAAAFTLPLEWEAMVDGPGNMAEIQQSSTDGSTENTSIVDTSDLSIMSLLENSMANIEMLPSKRTENSVSSLSSIHTNPVFKSKTMTKQPPSTKSAMESHRRNVPIKATKRVPYWNRYKSCDINQVSMNAFVQYLKTGRLCGRRVSRFRFALTG